MKEIYKWMAIVTGVLLLLALIFICMASKQIKRTTALVSEGTKVIKNSPAMMFVPLASYIAQLVAVSICALIICYLWTDPACPQQGVTRVRGGGARPHRAAVSRPRRTRRPSAGRRS